VRERTETIAPERAGSQAILPTAELALHAGQARDLRGRPFSASNPRRCRGWKYHNRSPSWYTRERCEDSSLPSRRTVSRAGARAEISDPSFDYELIYGMRRRFACEVTGTKLKIRIVDATDAQSAVLMHLENADRRTSRRWSGRFRSRCQLDAKLFPDTGSARHALNVSKGKSRKC